MSPVLPAHSTLNAISLVRLKTAISFVPTCNCTNRGLSALSKAPLAAAPEDFLLFAKNTGATF
jgi:hypothetical protein